MSRVSGQSCRTPFFEEGVFCVAGEMDDFSGSRLILGLSGSWKNGGGYISWVKSCFVGPSVL